MLAPSAFAGLANDAYRIDLQDSGALLIQRAGVSSVFRPEFVVLYRADDPKLALRPKRVPGVSFSVETWFTGMDEDKVSAEAIDLVRTVGDGWDPSILGGDQEGRTADVFDSGIRRQVKASHASEDAHGITWTFAADPAFGLSARIYLPPGRAEPVVEVSFTPLRDGYYSLGYTGAPSADMADVTELFQPTIWIRRRLPEKSYMTSAFRCTIPTALVNSGGQTWGVAADPAMLPFQPLPLLVNSQFGVVLRNPSGQAQPMIFSPILGGQGSLRKAGETYAFTLRPFLCKGSLHGAYVDIARNLMGLRDYRTNSIASLNQTLSNILDYAFTPYARFDEELRGSAYDTDVKGSVNNVTGLHPFSLALLMDDERIYRERAVPMFEAGLSRSKMLFTTDPNVKGQGASTGLDGPNMRGTEFAGWYGLTGRRVPWLLDLAKKTPITWLRNLAIYQATGDPAFLKQALSGGRIDYARMTESAEEMKSIGFWTTSWPWIAQWDLYEASKDPFFLKAAVQGAREYTHFIWTGPTIPDGDIEVNPEGKAPLYWYMKAQGKESMDAPRADVPAWRMSEIGLTSESAPTSNGHRAIFLAMPMPSMLRIGYMTGDSLFHDLARGAIIGRSRSFPGYHINTARSDVYEARDYPLRTLEQLSYNSFHYNHIWPHMAMLVEYLVTDVYGRSSSKVSFPGVYVEGYGYLQTHIYGGHPGRFFDQKDAWLWLPQDSVSVGDVEINWLAARCPDGVGLSFANQSFEPRRFAVKLGGHITGLEGRDLEVRVWTNDTESGCATIHDGSLTLDVPAQGLVSILLPGIRPELYFANRVGKGPSPAGGRASFNYPHGGGEAYLMSSGEGLTHAYVFVRANATHLSEARLRFRRPGEDWQTQSDSAYPYEFSVRWPDDAPFEAFISGTAADGNPIHEHRIKVIVGSEGDSSGR